MVSCYCPESIHVKYSSYCVLSTLYYSCLPIFVDDEEEEEGDEDDEEPMVDGGEDDGEDFDHDEL